MMWWSNECGFLPVVLSLFATIVIFLLLLDTIQVFLQTIRGYLAPYFLPNYEESTVKRYGEWALVTGCTDGIGKEYSFQLAKKGHSIILVSRNEEKLQGVAKQIENDYAVKTKIIKADFADGKEAIEKVKKEVSSLPVSILVNNVGVNYEYPMYVGEVPEQDLWNIINVNMATTTMLTRHFINEMRNRKRGAIVNVSSGSELQPFPLMTVYAASKAYIRSFTEALRYEYADTNLTIQLLSPLFINTKMNNFSDRLQRNSFFVPDAKMWAEYAVKTLGKVDHSTGFWTHGIQYFFASIPPAWINKHVGGLINKSFRTEYFRNNKT